MNPTEQLRLDLREGQCGLVGIGTVKGKTITQFLPLSVCNESCKCLRFGAADKCLTQNTFFNNAELA